MATKKKKASNELKVTVIYPTPNHVKHGIIRQLVLLESVLKNKRPKMMIFLFYREGAIIIGVQQYFSYIAVVNFIVGQSGVPVENLQVNDTPYHISCMK